VGRLYNTNDCPRFKNKSVRIELSICTLLFLNILLLYFSVFYMKIALREVVLPQSDFHLPVVGEP